MLVVYEEDHQGNNPIALAGFSIHAWPERLGPCTQLGVHIEKKPAINAIIYPYSSPADRLFRFSCLKNEEEMKPGKIRQLFCGRCLMKSL